MLSGALLQKTITRFVRGGRLDITTETGETVAAEQGSGPRVRLRLSGRGTTWGLLTDPELTLGEYYMDGRLVLEEGSVRDLFALIYHQAKGEQFSLPFQPVFRLRRALYALAGRNDARASRSNVANHYDLSGKLYDLFLDGNRQYSCAYFERPDQSLDEAQRAKMRHIAAKLFVEPGSSVLEIGSGWGGLSAFLAERAGAGRVRGITLSDEQLEGARRHAASRGLEDRVAFALEDYRATQGAFDRIVSVGMFEHVGQKSYDSFFDSAARLLKPGGIMLLHTIGRTGVPGYTNPWIRKYIFPGGHVPTLSEMIPTIERSGLAVTDIEILRLHYARTLKAWWDRFQARRAEAAALYDERFCRMWEFYLAASEASFLYQDLVVFQLQLTKGSVPSLPLTRDYIGERERRLRECDDPSRSAEVETLRRA